MTELLQTIADFMSSETPEYMIQVAIIAMTHALVTLREFCAAMIA